VANSKRRQILNYLRDTTFALITTTGGYNTTVVTKKRGVDEVDALPDSAFPALYIAATAEERQNITINQIQSRMQVAILGYVKNPDGTDGLQESLDDLVEDITKALETDRKLGGLAAKWLEIKSVTTDDGDQMPYGVVVLSVEIVYVSEGITP
jgi:hypothetical protein